MVVAGKNLGPKELAEYIDHTVLKPEATEEDIRKACAEAREYGFKGVCVEVRWLPVVVPLLKGSKSLAVTVVGFPSGTLSTVEKVRETETAIEYGAQEVDMVLNRDLLKEKNYRALSEDISKVVHAAGTKPVKVILETSELSHDEKVGACAVAKAAGAAFVKTSTGFSNGGATIEDVKLMRETVGLHFGVKASGGVRNLEQALAMIAAGASRIGTSAGVAIVKGSASSGGGY